MIQECEDHGALSLLLAMLTVTDNPNTDHALNAILHSRSVNASINWEVTTRARTDEIRIRVS
jgi:hypothetical protein